MTTYQNKKALVLEWAEGNPLSDVKKLAIPNFLKVSREIVSGLIAIHGHKICHLNLTCDHIILNGVQSYSPSRGGRCYEQLQQSAMTLTPLLCLLFKLIE